MRNIAYEGLISELQEQVTLIKTLIGAVLIDQGWEEKDIRVALKDDLYNLDFKPFLLEKDEKSSPAGNNSNVSAMGERIYKRIYESGSKDEDWDV